MNQIMILIDTKQTKLINDKKYRFINEKELNDYDNNSPEWINVCGDDPKTEITEPNYLKGYYQHKDGNKPMKYLHCKAKKIFNEIKGDGLDKSYIKDLSNNIDILIKKYKINDMGNDKINNYLKEKKENKEYNELNLLIDDLKKQKIIEFVYYIGGIGMIALFIINQVNCKK